MMDTPELDTEDFKPKKIVRIFLAHGKNDADDLIDLWREEITATLRANSPPGFSIEVVLGRDDFQANCKRCGSWDAWTSDVVERIDYATRDLIYAGIIVPSRHVGAATAKIVEIAISRGRTILYFAMHPNRFAPIRAVKRTSADFRNGWEIIT